MVQYRAIITLKEKGRIILDGVPFQAGDSVDIIVESVHDSSQNSDRFPLRGIPYQYDDPFSPVLPAEDWSVFQ